MVAEEQHQGEGKTGPTQGAERGGGELCKQERPAEQGAMAQWTVLVINVFSAAARV